MKLSLYDIQIGASFAKGIGDYVIIRQIVWIQQAEEHRRGRSRDACVYKEYELNGGNALEMLRGSAQARNMIRWAERLATPEEIQRIARNAKR
jgi:hypothetical protein